MNAQETVKAMLADSNEHTEAIKDALRTLGYRDITVEYHINNKDNKIMGHLERGFISIFAGPMTSIPEDLLD